MQNKIIYVNRKNFNQFLLYNVLTKNTYYFKITSKIKLNHIIYIFKDYLYIYDDNYEWRNIKNEINIKYFPILQLIYYKYKYGRIKNKRFK